MFFICISLITKSDCVWLIFVHILVSHVYLLWRKIYSSALSIFKSGYLSLLRNKSSLYSPAVKSIIKHMFYKLFSSLVGCVVFLHMILWHTKASTLIFYCYCCFCFCFDIQGVIVTSSFTKAQAHYQIQDHKGPGSLSSPVPQRLKNRQQFYSSRETLICFALVLLWCKVGVWDYSLTCGYPSYLALLNNRLFFTLLKDLVTLVKN